MLARYVKGDLRFLCVENWGLGFFTLGAGGGCRCRHLEDLVSAANMIRKNDKEERIEVVVWEREVVLEKLIYQKVS